MNQKRATEQKTDELNQKMNQKIDELTQKTTHKSTTEQKTEQKTGSDQKTVGDQKILMLKLIKGNPFINRDELGKKFGIHHSSIQRRLESLMKDGLIRRVGPDKGGRWEVINN